MRTYNLKIGGESFEARIVEYSETKVVVNLNGDTYEVEIGSEQVVRSPLPPGPPSRPLQAATKTDGGRTGTAPARSLQTAGDAEAAGTGQAPVHASRLSAGLVIAPIPGVVKSLQVKEGESVREGDVVLVLEAMKMDNEISSRASGTVKTIHVKVGDSVQEDQVLVDIEVK